MIQQDMFGQKRISIPDNPTLEKVAEMILNLSEQYPEMLDGNKISEIDRNIQYVVWMENGLRTILQSDWATTPQDRINEFEKWHKDSSKCINSDLLTRARRYLLEHDLIRVSAEAIRSGEKERDRLSKSFGKR